MAATVFNRAVSSASTDAPADLYRVAIPNYQERIKREDFVFFSGIKEGSPRPQAFPKINWTIQATTVVNDTLSTGINDSTTTITPTNVGYYQVYHLIELASGEIVHVQAVGATDLTVTRGFGGTTAAAQVNTALLNGMRIIGIATPENAESPRGPIIQGEVDYNHFTLMDSLRQFSDRARVTHTYESRSGDRMKSEMDRALKVTIPTYMEEHLIHGKRAAGTATAASSMGGVFQASFNSTNVAAAGAPLTLYQLLETLQTGWQIVGSQVAKTFYGHPFYGRILGTFFNGQRQVDASATTAGNKISSIMTDFGTISFMPHYRMTSVANPALPDGRLLFADLDDYRLIPYSVDKAHRWGIWDVYEGGAYQRRTVRGDYSLEAANPEKRAVISGLSTTAADYPLLMAS